MRRLTAMVLTLSAIVLVVWISCRLSVTADVDRTSRSAVRRLRVYSDLLLSRIDRFEHLPYVIAHDRVVLRMMEGRAPAEEASRFLKIVRERSGAAAVYVLDAEGFTLASSNFDAPTSFVGKNYAFREYFKDAVQGREGRLYAVGVTSGAPGYYLSHPVRLSGEIVGAAVVKLDLADLRDVWLSGNGLVVAVDPNGVIVLSSAPEWVYKSLRPLSATRLRRIRKGRLYAGKKLEPLALKTGESHGAAWSDIGGIRYLVSGLKIPEIGWELYVLEPWAPFVNEALRLGLFISLACLTVVGGVMFFREHRLKVQSERRLAEARRTRIIDREREESLRLLADSIAHQIRNPLLGIGGNANLLRRKFPENTAAACNLDTIVDCCGALERIVVAVREYIELVPSVSVAFDVSRVAERAVREAESLVPDVVARWNMELEPEVLTLDPELLRKALVEIFRNALESGGGEPVLVRVTGRVTASARYGTEITVPSDACYVISVCDNGAGVTRDNLKYVMNPFFSTKPNGVGLGLSKAKRVLQMFHGELDIDSPVSGEPGCRTRVRLVLPLSRQPG